MQDHAIEYLSAHSRGSPNNVQTHFKHWGFNRMAAVVTPETGRVSASFAAWPGTTA